MSKKFEVLRTCESYDPDDRDTVFSAALYVERVSEVRTEYQVVEDSPYGYREKVFDDYYPALKYYEELAKWVTTFDFETWQKED